jgi:cytochrome c553
MLRPDFRSSDEAGRPSVAESSAGEIRRGPAIGICSACHGRNRQRLKKWRIGSTPGREGNEKRQEEKRATLGSVLVVNDVSFRVR